MFHPRPCGCKGQRTCLVCEKDYGAPNIADSWITDEEKQEAYIYCPLCELAWPGWEADSWKVHPNHHGQSVRFPGVKLILNFLSEDEEKELMLRIDEVPWDLSQSGRKKQNYGPKCNFKKHRVRMEGFYGYPAFSKFIQDRFSNVDILEGFQAVEQCSLDYSVDRGASIDPHIDDCWIWGERIPTVSMLSNSVLTLRRFSGPDTKYNLNDTKLYPSVMSLQGTVKGDCEVAENMKKLQSAHAELTQKNDGELSQSDTLVKIIRLPMPRRSLLIFYGPPRYQWEHGILRQDILTRRVCITYRELTPTYLSFGSHSEVGEQILSVSKKFWDHRKFYGLNEVCEDNGITEVCEDNASTELCKNKVAGS